MNAKVDKAMLVKLQDTERLEWLFEDLNDVVIQGKIKLAGTIYAMRYNGCTTWREAIDLAREYV